MILLHKDLKSITLSLPKKLKDPWIKSCRKSGQCSNEQRISTKRERHKKRQQRSWNGKYRIWSKRVC